MTSQDIDAVIDSHRNGIMVVTDRYPPNSHGGAELSLHITLSRSEYREKCLVVTFNDTIDAPSTYELDGVSVIEFPAPTLWPYHAQSMKRFADNQSARRPMRAARKALWLLGYLFQGEVWRIPLRLRMIHLNYMVGVQGGVPADFDQVDHSLRRRYLADVVKRMQPATIHADNYRSILAVASLRQKANARMIGLVRDNRFACMNHNQSMMINGKLCGVCNFECYEHRKKHSGFIKSLFERTRRHRQHALHQMDTVVVTSKFLHDQIAGIFNSARIVYLPNPADDMDSIIASYRGVAELPGFNILVVGMLNENKGQADLVKKIDELVARVPDAKIYFAGRGERIEARINEIAAEKGLADRVEVLGYLSRQDLYRWMRRCQVVALPTMWPEPFGRVPLEAGMACRPVVAFKVGGLIETIRHEKTGLLVPHKQMSDFIEALGTLADDPGKMRRMGYAAFDHIGQNFQASARAKELIKVWKSR
ncbi:glycosyltransferase [Parvularcula flava]|uniref:Glycosyltransferase n=1 Tax=Aquisalinus luteolus TaxID=1566827 RepID=A0A8J3ESN2_9PROT|nr:glycosyltransferase [Aquisalinus luteolus]NHK29510.1 glycosyltransferase [Aquisalinus luteolus]GGI01720.1 hypothetical protein GCM10011355_33040 [Aquisalinus luteolus]